MAFEVAQSELIYTGRAFGVRRDQIYLPDGNLAWLDVVAHCGAIMLLPIDLERQVWFIRQYRHPAGCELLELPAGMMENGEDPEAAAHRELREETGMDARRLALIGKFFLAPGYSTELMHVFLAQDLYPAPLEQDEDEFLSLEKIPLQAAYRLVQSGGIQDAKTLAALLLARDHISQ